MQSIYFAWHQNQFMAFKRKMYTLYLIRYNRELAEDSVVSRDNYTEGQSTESEGSVKLKQK